MNKQGIMQLAVAVLLITNTVILALFTFGKLRNGKQAPSFLNEQEKHQKVKELFKFDELQFQDYLLSKRRHGDSLFHLSREQSLLSKEYYLLADEGKDSLLMDSIAELNARIYNLNKKHIQEIRDICREDQAQNLDSFIHSLIHR